MAAKKPVQPAVRKYMADIGAVGGSSTSKAKAEAARRNALLPRKRHAEGCACHPCILKRIRARSGR